MAHIVTAASAFPNHYYRQEEITTAIQKLWAGRPSNLERLATFHRNMQIKGRYLALPLEEYLQPSGFKERNQTWIYTALELGERAICQVLDQQTSRQGKSIKSLLRPSPGLPRPPSTPG